MANILLIETSSTACSVALSHDFAVEWHNETKTGPNHASCLGVYVQDALAFARKHDCLPDAVAVSVGPGSYTGLRIGVSEAKGVCFGLQKPLIAIPTLQILASHALFAIDEMAEDAIICPMIDARRMEVYTALFDRALNEVKPTAAVVVDSSFLSDELNGREVWLIGDGADKCSSIVTHRNARFLNGVKPMAHDMLALAVKAYNACEFVDVAYYTPFYLKEFVAAKPNIQKILHSGL